jgi:hypothetical protein
MVTAGYVVLLTVLVAGVGWGLWQLLAEFKAFNKLIHASSFERIRL